MCDIFRLLTTKSIYRVSLMVFNATFNNISVISWWSVLLVRNPEDPEKTIDLSQVTDKLYHMNGIRTHNFSGDIY